LQVSSSVHRNGNIAGNGNSGSVSPRSQGDTSGRKRLSDQTLDACGKKRRINEAEEQVGSTYIYYKSIVEGNKEFLIHQNVELNITYYTYYYILFESA